MFSLFMGKGDSSESPFFGVNRACVVIVLYFSVLFDAGFSEGGIGRHGSLAFNEDAVDDYPWIKGQNFKGVQARSRQGIGDAGDGTVAQYVFFPGFAATIGAMVEHHRLVVVNGYCKAVAVRFVQGVYRKGVDVQGDFSSFIGIKIVLQYGGVFELRIKVLFLGLKRVYPDRGAGMS